MAEKDVRMQRLETLFLKYSDLLYRISLVNTGNKSDAEDAVQETFVKYLSKPFAFLSDEQEKAWLVKVCTNTCRDILRKRNLRNHEPLEEHEDLSFEEESIGVYDAVKKLSENLRLVVVLHYLEDFTVDEIAKSLSLSRSAVKMRLLRAREELSKILGEERANVYK